MYLYKEDAVFHPTRGEGKVQGQTVSHSGVDHLIINFIITIHSFVLPLIVGRHYNIIILAATIWKGKTEDIIVLF